MMKAPPTAMVVNHPYSELPDGAILAVDFGLKRVGVAVCDPGRRVAVGVKCLDGLSGRALVREVARLADERCARVILIGEPPAEARGAGPVIAGADALAKSLTAKGFVIVRWSEAYTTAQVLSDRKRLGGKGGKTAGWQDVGAAVVMLREFLDGFS